MGRKKSHKPKAPGLEAGPPAQESLAPVSQSAESSSHVSKEKSKKGIQAAKMEPLYAFDEDPRPAKRQKTAATSEESRANQEMITQEAQLDQAPVLDDTRIQVSDVANLPPEVQHLTSKYEMSTMSILSSSKMEQKVRKLLTRTQLVEETKSKPGVVILTAKSDVAAKMVGIVEIAKRNIEKEGGQWWQYNALLGQTIELKKDVKTNRPAGGKTLREWEEEQSQNQNCTAEEAGASGTDGPQAKASTAREEDEDEDQDDDGGAFQTMGRHQVMAYDKNRSKLRAIPIMTIYLSRTPVPGLGAHCT